MNRLPHLVSFLLPKTASQPEVAMAVCLFVGLYGNLRVFSSWARFTPASEYNIGSRLLSTWKYPCVSMSDTCM